jgi:MFS family permease
MDGIRYINERPTLRYKQLQLILTMSLVMPVMSVVFRSYLKVKFDLDGGEFGFLFSMPAFGAMAGAMTFILFAFEEPIKNLRFAIPTLVATMLLLHFVPSPLWAGLALAVGGYFSYMAINSITQSIHFEIDDEYRGRLGSLIAMGFTALAPLMSYPLSLYTDHYGFERGIRDPVALYFIGSACLFFIHGYTSRNKVEAA